MLKRHIHHSTLSAVLWKRLSISILLVLISLPLFAKEKFFIAVGLAKPPYVIQATNTGFEIELIDTVLSKMGKSVEFVYTSFGHTSNMLAVDRIDAVMTTNSTLFNDNNKLSDVYITYQNIAISLKSNQFKIKSIKELANYSVASFQKADQILGEDFKNAVNQSPLFLQIADQKRQPSLLLKNKVEVVVMDKNIFNYIVRELKVEQLESRFTFHNIFPKTHYKMAFKTLENTLLFNKAFREYSNSANYQALLIKYKL